MRGVLADAVVIGNGQAGFFNSGGCPTVVMLDRRKNLLMAAHAGRESLYDSGLVDGNCRTPGRMGESVVHSILSVMSPKDMRKVFVFITCGIAGSNFSHSFNLTDAKMSERNKAMIAHLKKRWGASFLLDPPEQGKISLCDLVTVQCTKQGIPRDNIAHDDINTFADTYGNGLSRGENIWHDHRRDNITMPPEKVGRNGVLVHFAENAT